MLLFPIQFGGNCPVEVSIEQFSAPRIQPGMFDRKIALGYTGLIRRFFELRAKTLVDDFPSLGVELQALVEINHLLLHHGNRQRALIASVSLRVAARADEVLIDGAVAVFSDLNEQAALALPTEDGALQIQVVLANLLTEHP